MNDYIKTVIYTVVVFAYAAWNVNCFGVAPQGMSISYPKPAFGASSSLIQHESGSPFNSTQPNVQNKPTNTHISSTNSNKNIPSTNIPNTQIPYGSNTRDYVNPKRPSGQSSGGIQKENTQAATPVVNNQALNRNGTRQNTRDFVNTQPPPRQSTPPASAGSFSFQSQSAVRQPTRDYINPQFSRQSQQNNPAPTQNSLRSAATATTQKPSNSNRRDYVAPRPKPDFPVLPKSAVTQAPVGQNLGTTAISYAQKVSGGVTTESPVVAVNPSNLSSPTGSPESTPTTEKPLEGPTDAELRDFSEALLRRDVNNAGKYVTVNYQGKTTSQSTNDEAPEKLLQLNPEVYKIPTIAKLKLLHNNYILETNQNEHVTPQEKAEENDLLDAILSTSIMQYTRNYLISKDKISKDPKDFKDLLKQLWFNVYSRGHGKIGSSGFEHIFLAEIKKSEVTGLHNWVYFEHAENNKLVDYLGYMKKIDLGEKGAILKYHFKLNGVDKPVNSMFIGTSPELEIALYTTCYLFRADRICPLRLGGHNFIIRTYNFRYRGKNMIGSAFPEI